MVAIRFGTHEIDLTDGETVLDALLREGIAVPYSCRSGFCQTCLMCASQGKPPREAMQGLRDTWKASNYFLACRCKPVMDLEVRLTGDLPAPVRARVQSVQPLSQDILEIGLATDERLHYHPGQFINVESPGGLTRSYSLASVPGEDDGLLLQVRRLPGGRVSGWIHETLKPGDTLHIQGPLGDCFYCEGQPVQPLLLIGTGSGLAPLCGIARDALRQGHKGPIHLFHGSRSRDGLYLQDCLKRLAARHPQFQYTPCLSGQDIPPGCARGRVHEVAQARFPCLSGWRVFLCGHPDMVQQARMMAFMAGAAINDIYLDPFNVALT
jgi:NAD(P)H-flavin reductase/ferredoxin